MKDYRDVILAPVVTEQSESNRENQNMYTFKVASGTNKVEVRKAVENLFNVHVKHVTISNTPEKEKRRGRITYTKPGFKKAIVTVADGEKINIFQSAPEEAAE